MDPVYAVQDVIRVAGGRKVNVCLTGGEPFLQKHSELHELVAKLKAEPQVTVFECFSNGTIEYPEWALEEVSFIMDWKLPGSGEDPFNPTRIKNLHNLTDKDAVKFVIADRDDFELARRLYYDHIESFSPVEVFYGIVWNRMTNATLVNWVLQEQLPWRLNIQVHNHIWDRRKRGI